MSKKPYLNVGCGSKYHVDWTNIDMKSSSAHVQAHNLLQGFPYRSDCFEAVYHSQVLEHFPREKAPGFLGECLRVLKPRGIIRVVVPDLENIAKEYLGHLAENLEHPSELARANYDWIMLELYDQTVRDRSGGRMAEFLSQPGLVNESYVLTRSGRVARGIIEKSRSRLGVPEPAKRRRPYILRTIKKIRRYASRRFTGHPLIQAVEIGRFRLGGEIHLWMYDRFSLSELLKEVGFEDIRVVSPYESSIPEWDKYELDVRDGNVCDPCSLFMEAVKPPVPA
ncbi:MAG: class I SAM-dependent methyltransferase [Rhodospirillales bacterium]